MHAILWPIVTWIFREVVLKFVLMGLVFVAVSQLGPFVFDLIGNQLGGISGAFSGLTSGVWWVLDAFAIAHGAPLVVSAYVTRFLIRRIPIIG